MTRAAHAVMAALLLAACARSSAGETAPRATTSATSTTTTKTTTTAVPTTTTTLLLPGPTRAITIGDSLAYDLAPAFGAMLQAGGADFRDQSFPGLGFSVKTAEFVWRSFWGKVLADNRPDLVIFLAGPWDARSVTIEGQGLVYGTPPWRAWYDGELDAFVGLVHSVGARLIWLTAPTYQPGADGATDLGPVNSAYRAVSDRWPDVEVVDTDAAVDGPDGSFARYLPGPTGTEEVRKADGLHFCPAGATRVALALLPAIRTWWSFSPAADWDRGEWRREQRYVHPIYGDGCAVG